MTEKLRSSAIAAAVVCLPMDVCRLTADFLIEQPHRWSSFETISAVLRNQVETDLVCSDAPVPKRWRKIVSSDSLATGDLRWTVDVSADGGPLAEFVLMDASTANYRRPMLPDFYRLRPCVVLFGSTSAVVRSGS